MASPQGNDAPTARYSVRLGVARQWVNRRVETFTFLDADTVRRRMSIDLTLPATGMLGEGDTALVPLMMLEKRDLRNLDVRGPEDQSLPVLNTAQNTKVAVAGLKAHIEHLLADLQIADAEKTVDGGPLTEVVESRDLGGTLAIEHLAPGQPLARSLAHLDPGVRSEIERLIRELERSFLLLVPLDYASGRRLICKVSYDAALKAQGNPSRLDRLYWRANRILSSVGLLGRLEVFDNLPVGLCSSYHAELVPPRDVYVVESALTVLRQGATIEDEPERDEHKFRPHVRSTPKARGDVGTLTVIFHAHRQELLLPLAFSGLLITVVLGLLPANVYVLDRQTLAALLLVPFALSAYYIRGQENNYVTHMLAGVRLLALLPLAAALFALTLEALGQIPTAAHTVASADTLQELRIAFIAAATPTVVLFLAVVAPFARTITRRPIRALQRRERETMRAGGDAAPKHLTAWAIIIVGVLLFAGLGYGCWRGASIWLKAPSPSAPSAMVNKE
jgi:hypothetical protein